MLVAYLYSSRAIQKQRRQLYEQFDTIAKGITQASNFALQNLPTAMVIIDSKARVCWCNSVFRDWMPQDPDKTQRLNGFIPSLRLDKSGGSLVISMKKLKINIIVSFTNLLKGPNEKNSMLAKWSPIWPFTLMM